MRYSIACAWWTTDDGTVIVTDEELYNLGENMTDLTGRAMFLERRMIKMQKELDRIQMLPDEPEGLEQDGTNVIIWDARFPHGTRVYSYAARKAGDGKWYTTGPRSEQGYTWADLIMWISNDARPVDGVIWPVTEVTALPIQ